MTLDPRRLLVLRAVETAGSVVGAASALHVSPSAVSQQVAKLEREARASLVDRTQHRLTLTSAGRVLSQRAARVERELALAERELAALTGRVSGPVSISAFATVAEHLVAPALLALAEEHPGIEPHITVESHEADAVRRLRSGTSDVAILEEMLPHQLPIGERLPIDGGPVWRPPRGLAGRSLLDDCYRVVVPAAWPTPTALGDLVELPWIIAVEGAARAIATAIGVAAGAELPVAHECCEFPTTLAFVAAGMGAAVVPTLALPRLPDGVVLPSLPAVGVRRIHAVHPDTRSGPPPAVDALLRAVAGAAAAVQHA